MSHRGKETLLCLILSTLIESERECLFPTVTCYPIKAHFTQQGTSARIKAILKDENIKYVKPPASITRTFQIKKLKINVFYS